MSGISFAIPLPVHCNSETRLFLKKIKSANGRANILVCKVSDRNNREGLENGKRGIPVATEKETDLTYSRPFAKVATAMLLVARDGKIQREQVEELVREKRRIEELLAQREANGAVTLGGSNSADVLDELKIQTLRQLMAVTVGAALFLLKSSERREGKEFGIRVGSWKVRGADIVGRLIKRSNERTGFDVNVWRDSWRELEDALKESWREFEDGLLLWRHVGKDWKDVSELKARSRDIVVVTTAALPWFTGTSVNPLLRAIHLARDGHHVTLVLPWLSNTEDQKRVFPRDVIFSSQSAQAQVVQKWIQDQQGTASSRPIDIVFYDGVYSKDWGSIFPVGDITDIFKDNKWKRDVCVLEEPEHLTWHHTGERWAKLFNYVVGVIHTNYLEYAKSYDWFGPQRALFLEYLNKWVCRCYCHRVIKLSDAVQDFPLSVTCNIHGVREKFIDIGKQRRNKKFTKGAYFLGKVLWAKGYNRLVELMEDHYQNRAEALAIDFFGTGPDLAELEEKVQTSNSLAKVNLHGLYIDHAADALQEYKLFVNPSDSDVVCTATAEALAMGKFVVCLEHSSNEFFASFNNCLVYRNAKEFSRMVSYALRHDPEPLTEEEMYRLTWKAATERFYDAARITDVDVAQARVDEALAVTHKTICSTLVAPPSDNAVRKRFGSNDTEWSTALRRLRQQARRKDKTTVNR